MEVIYKFLKKNKKMTVIAGVIIVILLTILIISNTNNKLNGKWSEYDHEFSTIIELSGKSFTLKQFVSVWDHGWYLDKIGEYFYYAEDEWNRAVNTKSMYAGDITRNVTSKGKYSISGNTIEFVYSDGNVEVYSFYSTENTINIDGRQFKKTK